MQLQLNFSDAAGRSRQFSQPITVTNHDFGTQDLELSSDQAYLADHAADDYDDAMLADVYNAYTPQLLWNGKWQWPLKLDWTLTTNFAQRRTINGKPDTLYYHGGLDMAPNSGQEGGAIYAPATGKVVYIGLLQARGNTIALDHGLGVTSYYFHLSHTNVKVGQVVQPGDLLGAIGTTGRATGPHLHWEVRVNGIITDPRTFIEQDLSK
jgi:lysostaphin